MKDLNLKSYRFCIWLMLLCLPTLAQAEPFSYSPPGSLVNGSGTGRVDDKVYVPDMRFPIEEGPAYPNSQVWGVGGSKGPAGGQCDTRNYSYPWWDNYCETRSWDVALCPSGKGHQGQDIRPGTCEKDKHWVVSAEDGKVTSIGSYSVYIVSDNGTRHRYLHMKPSSIPVSVGDRVAKGDRIGLVSNAFNGTPTTIHLHYDIYQNIAGVGQTYVPTYMSLVRSYERLLGQPAEPCDTLSAQGGTLDDKSPCFRLLGNLQYWRKVTDEGFDGQLYWTYAFSSDRPGSYARWTLEFAEAGQYKIEVYAHAGYNESKQVPYRVRFAGQELDVKLDSSTKSGWHELGTWDFATGGDQFLEIYDNSGEATDLKRKMTADAIRLVRVDAMPPIEDMGTDMSVVEDMNTSKDMSPPKEDMSTNTQDMDSPQDMADKSKKVGGTQSTSTSTCASASPSGTVPIWLWVVFGAFGRLVWRRKAKA